MTDVNSNQAYNIVTLIKRLEAATSRLEDLTTFHKDSITSATNKAATNIQPGSTPVTEKPPVIAVSSTSGGIIDDHHKIITGVLQELLKKSKEIDPLLAEQTSHVIRASEALEAFLKVAIKSAPPALDDPTFQDLYKEISKQAEQVITIRESNRKSKVANHLSALAEGVPALGWIGVETPLDYIKDFKDSAQFYSNRILKEFKGVDDKHVEWVKVYMHFFTELLDYVTKYHKKGVAYDPSGVPLSQAIKENISTESIVQSDAPPPPPPPPMPPAEVFETSSSTGNTGGMSAVFQELNKGENVTSGLKKVDKTQMTHKNPELKKQPPKVPEKKGRAISTGGKKSIPSPTQKRTPKKEFSDSKWTIMDFENEHDIVIDLEINNGVFIDRCNNCTIQLKGKGNAVSINQCTKVGVLVENLVSSVSVNKSSGFGVQVSGVVPTISVDQCENGQIYLSQDSIKAEVYTAQSASINVNIPKQGGPEGEFIELPLPEQIVHKFGPDGTVNSTFVQHG